VFKYKMNKFAIMNSRFEVNLTRAIKLVVITT
jgi:hypothetical protein